MKIDEMLTYLGDGTAEIHASDGAVMIPADVADEIADTLLNFRAFVKAYKTIQCAEDRLGWLKTYDALEALGDIL